MNQVHDLNACVHSVNSIAMRLQRVHPAFTGMENMQILMTTYGLTAGLLTLGKY